MSGERFVVVASRVSFDGVECGVDEVVLGTFRRRERADARAATVRRLAEKYDDEQGTLYVTVEPIRSGTLAAQAAMDYLYGAIT